MSFYQEYLKKQREQGSGAKAPDNSEINIEEDSPESPIDESEKEDIVPPAIPVRINSDNTEGKFSEIQKREEMERQAFMSRVKGENIPESPAVKEIPEENLRISVPPKQGRGEKLLIRLIIVLALMAIIGAISLLWYRTVREGGPGTVETIREVVVEEVFVSEVIAPRSIFRYDRFEYPLITRSNEFASHFLQYMALETDEEALVKVMFRDQRDPGNPSFITARTFLNSFSIAMPSPFNERVDQESLNVFVHLKEDGNEAGFAVVIDNFDGFSGMMREWEDNAPRDVNLFLSFLGKETQPEAQIFAPVTHRQNVIRCLEYRDGSDICYATVRDALTNIFVFATSSDTVRALIDSN